MHRMERENAPGLSSRNVLLAAVVILALAAPAHADVTLKERTVSTGLAGFGNGTSERTVVIAGDRSRSDDQYTYTGRFKTLAGGGKPRTSVDIVRLDRDLLYTLDPARKQYTEMSFAEMREAMAAGMARARAERNQPEDRKAARDVEMSYQVDVQRTGKKEKINGFPAENVIVTITATARDKKDGDSGSYTIRIDEWLAPQVPGQDETRAYYRRFAEKMGLDPQLQQLSGLLRQYQGALEKAAEKMKDLKGYPVRSTTTLQLGEASTPEQQAQMDKAREEASRARAEQEAKKEAKEDEEAKADASGSLAHGDVGGALGGLLGRKLGKSAEKKAKASSQEPGSGTPGGLTITTDVLGITTGTSAASFDVPSDFKKVERRH